MVSTVFDVIRNSPDYIEFKLKASIVEIYMEKIRDLLDISKKNLKVREDKNKGWFLQLILQLLFKIFHVNITSGVYIQDVTEEYVVEDIEIYNLM